MTFPEIPQNITDKVKLLFRSEKRMKIAEELLLLDHWPKKDEKQAIAEKYDFVVSSIDKILYRLRDNNYFSKEHGSIPLYSKNHINVPRCEAPEDFELNKIFPILEIKIPSLAMEIKIHSYTQKVGTGG